MNLKGTIIELEDSAKKSCPVKAGTLQKSVE